MRIFLEKKIHFIQIHEFYMKKMRFEHDKKQFAVKRRFHNALCLLFFVSLLYLLWSKIVTIYLFCIMHPIKHNNCNNLVSCHKGNSVKPIKVISTINSTY